MSWLPVESMMRFRGVSKSWYALINDLIKNPIFVAKHLQNSMSSGSKYLLFSSGLLEPNNEVELKLLNLLTDNIADNEIHFATDDLTKEIPGENYVWSWNNICHCNGIFCIVSNTHMDRRTITLYNPAIKESKRLPESSFMSVHGSNQVQTGFGYDSRANDYKVITFGFDRSKNLRAEVYYLSTDSWREICFNIEVDKLVSYSSAYLNGVYFWPVETPKHMILSFDMCDEVFQTISMPSDNPNATLGTSLGLWNESFDKSLYLDTRLVVWNESLAVIYTFFDEDQFSKSSEMWVMDNWDTSIKGSGPWKRIFTYEHPEDVDNPIEFWNNDELLMEDSAGDLVSYNICSRKLRKINFDSKRFKKFVLEKLTVITYWCFSYVKSLVSVQGRD